MDMEALQSTLAELQGLRAAHDKLTIRASFNGKIRDLSDSLRPDEWLAKDEPLGVVISPSNVVISYAEEADLQRLQLGVSGVFYPDGADLAPILVSVFSIDPSGTRQLSLAELSSRYGGTIAVREDEQHHLIPEQGVYRLQLDIKNTNVTQPYSVRGRLKLNTPAESISGRLVRSALAVMIRESGW